jgi:carbon monoxide dehydrogenase subunit G
LPSIDGAVEIDATPEQVWAVLQQIDRHVEWMYEAVAVRFIGEQTSGVDTEFFCDTKVGPFKLVDRMIITEWSPPTTMGVRHTGAVTGEGMFTLQQVGAGSDEGRVRTHFTWQEQLRFPWWLGGRVGAAVAGPAVLRPIWKRNLRAFKRQIESPQ